MKAYYLVFFLTLMFSLFIEAKTDKQWRWKLFWTFLPLFIYAAIRVDYGNDYISYSDFFDTFHNSSYFDTDSHAELGYQLLNKIMPSFRSILVLNAFLLSLAFGVFCYHNIPRQYLWLAVILIFLNPEKNIFGNLVGIRNGLVVTSFLLGYVFIQKRQIIPFIILTIGLMTIHTSAVFFLPIAYLVGYNKPFSQKEIYLWSALIFGLFFFSLTTIADYLGVILQDELVERYEEYLVDVEFRRGALITIVNSISVVLFLKYFLNRGHSLSPENNSLLRLGILYSVMFFLGSFSTRASYFYDLFYIGSVVLVYSDKRASQNLRIAVVALAIVTSLYSMFYVWMGSQWWNHGVYHSLLGDW